MARQRVTLVALGDASEALFLRALFESMDFEVRLLRVTTLAQVAPALIRASDDDVIVLSAEGGADGLRLGPQSWVTAEAAFEGVDLRDDTVLISTAARTRESGLAAAMYQAGGRLVAPEGSPDRSVIVPWIGACLLASDAGLPEAVSAANALVGKADRFNYG